MQVIALVSLSPPPSRLVVKAVDAVLARAALVAAAID